jgi:hypothetical protein
MSRGKHFAWLGSTAFLVVALSTIALASSHVRIVRLSSVEGQVKIDRAAGAGLERAILNTPIVEGTRLVTGSDGLAEVEFENESALRLTGDSQVKFTELQMSDSGAKINHFEIAKGLVYLDTASKGDDIYRVSTGKTSLLVHRDTVMRLSATADKLQVAVLKGDVQLENQAQPVSIHKKQTLTVDLQKPAEYAVANGTEADRFDNWNKEREDYSRTYAENDGYSGPTRAYGLQDLNYYGNFFYANGYGYAWQPYGFAGSMINWSPYSNGAWMFYPGMGYSWASAYPWGWLPFHYGSWAYLNGAGWAWLPGGGYSGGQWYASNFLVAPRITRVPEHWAIPAPPAILAGNTAPKTVLVGSTDRALTIPGGRIPPEFASVIPGRTPLTAGTHGFARAEANVNGNHAVFADTNNLHQGHVFAPRSDGLSSLHGPNIGGMFSGSREGMVSPSAVHTGIGNGSANASSGGAHK